MQMKLWVCREWIHLSCGHKDVDRKPEGYNLAPGTPICPYHWLALCHSVCRRLEPVAAPRSSWKVDAASFLL